MEAKRPWVGHLTKPVQVCFCNDGWICEEHPEQGWPHGDCSGPCMPCHRCNPGDPPQLPSGWHSIARVKE